VSAPSGAGVDCDGGVVVYLEGFTGLSKFVDHVCCAVRLSRLSEVSTVG
jgi:hypothetical protein